jgi:hypothetical protein
MAELSIVDVGQAEVYQISTECGVDETLGEFLSSRDSMFDLTHGYGEHELEGFLVLLL